jgi:hypothetical protein
MLSLSGGELVPVASTVFCLFGYNKLTQIRSRRALLVGLCHMIVVGHRCPLEDCRDVVVGPERIACFITNLGAAAAYGVRHVMCVHQWEPTWRRYNDRQVIGVVAGDTRRPTGGANHT